MIDQILIVNAKCLILHALVDGEENIMISANGF